MIRIQVVFREDLFRCQTPAPYWKMINRGQMLLRAIDVDHLIELERPPAAFWNLGTDWIWIRPMPTFRAVEGWAVEVPDPGFAYCRSAYSRPCRIGSGDCGCVRSTRFSTAYRQSISHFCRIPASKTRRRGMSCSRKCSGCRIVRGLMTLECVNAGTEPRSAPQEQVFSKEDRIHQHLDAARQHAQAVGHPVQGSSGHRRNWARIMRRGRESKSWNGS